MECAVAPGSNTYVFTAIQEVLKMSRSLFSYFPNWFFFSMLKHL
jgi:hypothetical protein